MIPDKVKVAGIEYQVQEVEEQVFIHELPHGCLYEAGIEEQEEDIINRVSIVLYQVLKDNKLYFGSLK